jgi:hypothetical protein
MEKIMSLVLSVLAVSVCLPFVALGQEVVYRVEPVDEADQDHSFLQFREELLVTIEHRDVEALIEVIDPNVLISFGMDNGIEHFMEEWDPASPESEIWDELAVLLRMGGTFQPNGAFYAPYVFTEFPDDLEPFMGRLILGPNVPLYELPDTSSNILTYLSYNAVRYRRDSRVLEGWTSVMTQDNRAGFVEESMVHGPIDYRAGFTKKNGNWIMTCFVAGD